MKVTVVCDVLGEKNNGTTIAAYNLIESLKKKGHEVRVVCSDEERRGQEGFFVCPTFDFGPLNNYVKKNGVAPAKADMAVLEAALCDVDIIHVMIPFSMGKAAAHYAHEHGIPLTAGFHCQAENVTGHIFLKDVRLAGRIAYRAFYNRVYKYCDGIHYPSRFICDTFEDVVGPTPRYIISNGVAKEFRPVPCEKPEELRDKFTVLFIGRYSPEKSHKVLIDGAALSKYKDKLRLVFAGAGPLEEKLRERAKKRGLNEPVMKFFSREELVKTINTADLYVHPAEIEIEAISCLEAIACGCTPLIADSPRSATRAFALGENNLFRVNDPADLAKKLDFWIEHPEEREKCSRDYLGYASRFDFDRCMDRMEEMMISVVRNKKNEG
ncbi:MAG: glycosyltransferase [Oscillospiraceae bacterium]|nr:glycosyltransferase [Oscillospiraceae bacterium]